MLIVTVRQPHYSDLEGLDDSHRLVLRIDEEVLLTRSRNVGTFSLVFAQQARGGRLGSG